MFEKLAEDIYMATMNKIAYWDVGMEKDAVAFVPISSPAANSRFLNGPGKPGFFQRIGQGFKNLRNKVKGFFGGGGNTQDKFVPKKVTNINEAVRTNKYDVNPKFERHPLDIEEHNNSGKFYTLRTDNLPIHGEKPWIKDSPKPFKDREKFVEVFKSRARTNPESIYGSRPLNDPIFQQPKEKHWFNAGISERDIRGRRSLHPQNTVSDPNQKGYYKEILEPYMDTYQEFSARDFNNQIDNLKNMSEQEYQRWFNNEPIKALVSSKKWYDQPIDPRLNARISNDTMSSIWQDFR